VSENSWARNHPTPKGTSRIEASPKWWWWPWLDYRQRRAFWVWRLFHCVSERLWYLRSGAYWSACRNMLLALNRNSIARRTVIANTELLP
jgi:hypothetical protein